MLHRRERAAQDGQARTRGLRVAYHGQVRLIADPTTPIARSALAEADALRERVRPSGQWLRGCSSSWLQARATHRSDRCRKLAKACNRCCAEAGIGSD